MLFDDYVRDCKDAKTSPDLKERADGFFRVQHFGITYYVPVTKEMKKLLKLKRKGDKIEFSTIDSTYMIDKMLRDIIAAVYIQLRDTVGAEIKEELMGELKGNINKMLNQKFNNVIEERMQDKEQKLLSSGK
jgi:hypothetical protein